MLKNVAIILSGCGVFDGSEIHEAVVTLNAVESLGATAHFFAPDKIQFHCIDHSTMQEANQVRNVLVESARIARGTCANLESFDGRNFDALIFVGGFGAAKNLSDFAFKGAECSVDEDVERSIKQMLELKKPMGFICISPCLAAKVISNKVKITIGNDADTAKAIESLGAIHVNCEVDSFVKDEIFNVFSTPAYMLAKNTVELSSGINAMIKAMQS